MKSYLNIYLVHQKICFRINMDNKINMDKIQMDNKIIKIINFYKLKLNNMISNKKFRSLNKISFNKT